LFVKKVKKIGQEESTGRKAESMISPRSGNDSHSVGKETTAPSDEPVNNSNYAPKPRHFRSENQRFVSRIRSVVDAGIEDQASGENPVVFSERISKEFGLEYGLLEQLFLLVEDTTLERFILSRKIEKVKEILVYTDKPLSETARTLGFEGTARLSQELKKHTGYGPDYYAGIRQEKLSVIREAAKGRGSA
jgi:AraC-like DNA-binding protein